MLNFRSPSLACAALFLASMLGASTYADAQTAVKQPSSAVSTEKHPGMRALAKMAAEGDAKREASYLALLEGAVYQQSIIDAISRPAEGKAWKDYRPIFLTPARIAGGVKFWRENRASLAHAEEKYGASKLHRRYYRRGNALWRKCRQISRP